ncbi:MAG: hypothetical protein U0X76_13190 [Bacteroidia bacterium]
MVSILMAQSISEAKSSQQNCISILPAVSTTVKTTNEYDEVKENN